MVDQPISFSERLKKLQQERAAQNGFSAPPAVQQPSWDPTLIPDVGSDSRRDGDAELDRVIDHITVEQAYNKWIGKSVATGSKRDGNKVSCPFPNHPDKDPSAWFNTENNTWFCGGCQQGGDVYDLAAIHFNYPMPGYKEGKTFHELRERMAESFGYRVKKVAGGTVVYQESEGTPDIGDTPGLKVAPTPAQAPASGEPPASGPTPEVGAETEPPVSRLYAVDEDEDGEVVLYPTIDWRRLVPEDTFLREYLEATSQDDSPEEYHFWHGLLALGHAVGRNVTLDDSRPVYSNLMVCLLGATGTGKSRSRGWLDVVLKAAVPYQEDGARTTGAKIVSIPASGEYLIHAFSYEGKDPSNNKSSLGYQPVNGIVDFDEMSALLARANREGSTLKPTVMALADARDEVRTGSLTRGDFIASRPFCSITASTQPKAIRTLLSRTDTGSGFLNRWIFAGGKEKQIEALGGSHSSTVINLDASIAKLKNVRGWGAMERSLTLEPDAYDAYVRFFRATIEPLKRGDETDLLKRIDLISKKLMLLFAINTRSSTVPLAAVEAMTEIIGYVVECFSILNKNIGVTVMQDVMNEIERHIKRHKAQTGRGASVRDIARYTARKNYTNEQIKRALEVMTALDLIELAPKPPGPGRPAIRYQAVGE